MASTIAFIQHANSFHFVLQCVMCFAESVTRFFFFFCEDKSQSRGGSRTAATSKMERLVIIVNGFQLLTIITKRSIFCSSPRSASDSVTNHIMKFSIRKNSSCFLHEFLSLHLKKVNCKM